MNYTIYDYLGLFFLYAFLGWLLETTVAAVRKKHMVNRGFLNGPLCAIYGITAVFMTRYLYELQSSPVFLFLGCMIIATAAEWIAGHVLERIGHGKWWDYSNKKWNMDGYICLQYSVLWGILGVLALKFGNILGLTLLHLAPNGVMHITLWILFGVLVVDAIGSYAVLRHITKKMPRIAAMNDQIDAFTKRLSVRLYRYLEARVERRFRLFGDLHGEKADVVGEEEEVEPAQSEGVFRGGELWVAQRAEPVGFQGQVRRVGIDRPRGLSVDLHERINETLVIDAAEPFVGLAGQGFFRLPPLVGGLHFGGPSDGGEVAAEKGMRVMQFVIHGSLWVKAGLLGRRDGAASGPRGFRCGRPSPRIWLRRAAG